MKSVLILSALASIALAQSSNTTTATSSATPTATSNPLIPSQASQACQDFLTQLDNDPTLPQCLTPILAATAKFAPGNSSSATESDVNAALATLCVSPPSTGSCSDSTIKTALAKFYTACQAELTTNKIDQVITTYDSLYILPPFKQAICSKDSSGNACPQVIKSNIAASASGGLGETPGSKSVVAGTSSSLLASLYTSVGGSSLTRRDDSQVPLLPNATTYDTLNVPFLFLTPDMSADTLCTICTRQVLSAYLSMESSISYAPGLASSQLIGGQTALYNAVINSCGQSFITGGPAVAAGSLSGAIVGAATRGVGEVNGQLAALASFASVAVGLAAFL